MVQEGENDEKDWKENMTVKRDQVKNSSKAKKEKMVKVKKKQ